MPTTGSYMSWISGTRRTDNKTISVYNLKSAFYENKDMPNRFIQSFEMFYDAQQGFFTQFDLGPNEHRTILMYPIFRRCGL